MNSGPSSSARSLAAPVSRKMIVAQCRSCGMLVAMIQSKTSREYFLNGYLLSISGPHDDGFLIVASCPPWLFPGYVVQSVVMMAMVDATVSKPMKMCRLS